MMLCLLPQACMHGATGRERCIAAVYHSAHALPAVAVKFRLVNGTSPNSGRLEVALDGVWGKVRLTGAGGWVSGYDGVGFRRGTAPYNHPSGFVEGGRLRKL